MIKIFCDYCEKPIPQERVLRRKKPLSRAQTHFCNVDCLVAYQKKIGHFKHMSDLGKAGRAAVLPKSNREKPRRKKI